MAAWRKLFIVILTCAVSSVDPGRVCDSINDPDVKYFDIRLPVTDVPKNLTTYVCQAQDIPLPMNVAYHAIAFEPIIDNKGIMHHMLLFGCNVPKSETPHKCVDSDFGMCRSFLTQWSMGIKGQISSFPDTGVRFGLDSFQSLSLQIHWNNKHLVDGMTDSSGVRIYYTTHLKKYDSGNFQVGQNDLQIPAGVAHYPTTGGCSSECTRRLLPGPIYLTRVHIHMHYVGDGGVLILLRDGKYKETVANETTFDYNNPVNHDYDRPVEVLPGDELRLTCFFNTRDGVKKRNHTLHWAEGSDGEMCYAFIAYHPLIRGFDQCIQFDNRDICYTETDQRTV